MQVARNTFIIITLGLAFNSAMADISRISAATIRQPQGDSKTKPTSPVAPTSTTTTTTTTNPPPTQPTTTSYPSAPFSPVQIRF